MIVSVHVVPRLSIKGMLTSKFTDEEINNPDFLPWHFIHIHSIPDSHFANPAENTDNILIDPTNVEKLKKLKLRKYLSISFMDITDEKEFKANRDKYPSYARMISDADAESIVDFLDEIDLGTEHETLVVQCDAGKSRSGAVGSFANNVFYAFDAERFLTKHPGICPNPYVYRALCRAYDLSADTNSCFGFNDSGDIGEEIFI